jgi:hypothetical protein
MQDLHQVTPVNVSGVNVDVHTAIGVNQSLVFPQNSGKVLNFLKEFSAVGGGCVNLKPVLVIAQATVTNDAGTPPVSHVFNGCIIARLNVGNLNFARDKSATRVGHKPILSALSGVKR